MFFRILKKDLKRKRAMNLILLLFIILATMFLSSSVENLRTVMGAVDRYMEKANTPNLFILANQDGNDDVIMDFLKDNSNVKACDMRQGIILNNCNIKVTERKDSPKASNKKSTDSDNYETEATSALFTSNQKYMKVFNENGKKLTLQKGELAIPPAEADKNNLQVGDTVKITIGSVSKKLKITHLLKDAVFGSSMMGFHRFIISEEDYKDYEADDASIIENLYSVNTTNSNKFQKQFQQNNFNIFTMIEKSLIKTCYLMDMLVAGILIIVSVCLILIAFFILRFTIVFTIQEDYREIGCMKAIGIRNIGIKSIYMIKYFTIAICGAVIGVVAGMPFANLLLKSAIMNIVIDDTTQNIFIYIGCAILVVILVVLFCYTSTCKLNKISAIEAIREGGTGERFNSHNRMQLATKRRLSTPVFLACNDITGSIRRFLILAVTFCLTTLLILLPLSAIQTLKSDSVVRLFSIAPSDAYVKTQDMETYVTEGGDTKLDQGLKRIEDKMKDAGYKVSARAEIGYYFNYYLDDPKDSYRLYTAQAYHYGGDNYDMVEGTLPQGDKEIALTTVTAKDMGVTIGDTIHMNADGKDYPVMVSGIFQTMNNMGKGARISEDFKIAFKNLSGMYALQVDFDRSQDYEQTLQALKEALPDDTVYRTNEYSATILGDIIEQMDVLKALIVVIVLLINALITVLMMKALMTKERTEIATLKSIGFSNHTLRSWQTIRIMIILLVAIILAILLSKLLAPLTVGQVFVMMGATKISMITNPLETYLFYPLLLLLVNGVCAYICAGNIKRVDIKEMNN